jgi:small subunit ribosomal protein S24e
MEVERRLLSDGTEIAFETARQFMDYYCRRFGFGKPDIAVSQDISKPTKGASRLNAAWEAVMTVGGRRIGVGTGISKKHANINCYIDVCQYLESCDRELWEGYVAFSKSKQATMAPNVWFQISDHLEDGIGDLCDDLRKSQLYANRPKIGSGLTGFDVPPSTNPSQPVAARNTPRPGPTEEWHQTKSKKLLANYEAYQSDPRVASMRRQRLSLPVTSCANDILSHLAKEDVTICMATTGSGKTTQIPQLIFDDWIKRGEGSRCNIICTQPRRIAAISVAERVAAERGERVGMSVGYQVRFEAKLPTDHGSVTFCTTGTFLRRMQSALGGTDAHERSRMDDVTHVLVDEVHERDIDTDLLLVVLKRLLNDRKARNKSLKIVLMSATIDPTLFQTYFADDQGKPAQIAEVPGRLFPVEKRYLDELVAELSQSGLRDASWVLGDKKVVDHLQRELGPPVMDLFSRRGPAPNPPPQPIFGQDEDLDIPYPLVALTVAHVLKQSDSGHVLVFLPGWDEITAVQNILLDRTRPLLGVDFTDPRRFSIHLLHSSIPIAEQQAVFEPAAPGVRRIILATNIAETSITIPDVVYVVDTGKIKEKRYDPERHMSSLVSAWVGTSNLNQRAGRAGRHRSGQYYGLMSRGRVASLHSHQLVEMKRADLSNVVMHVKALDFPGMEIEEVLAATIEPPAPSRVSAAITNLQRVGALDPLNNLTSLGRVLLQLPVEVAVGRLVLLGSFFKCLDSALTLAAILTNRDPFMAPIALKQEANAIKNSWTPAEFRSDSLAILRAYNAWERLQQRGDFVGANRFCVDNFLSRTTLLLIEKIKGHLLQSLYNAGVIDVSSGGAVRGGSSRPRDHTAVVPPELNSNGDSLPLLAALIAAASQPNFAVRASDKIYRTSQDKVS